MLSDRVPACSRGFLASINVNDVTASENRLRLQVLAQAARSRSWRSPVTTPPAKSATAVGSAYQPPCVSFSRAQPTVSLPAPMRSLADMYYVIHARIMMHVMMSFSLFPIEQSLSY